MVKWSFMHMLIKKTFWVNGNLNGSTKMSVEFLNLLKYEAKVESDSKCE